MPSGGKHPVIKKKLSRPRGRRRFAAWQRKIRQLWLGKIQLRPCQKCGATRQAHTPCPACGWYRERVAVPRKTPKVAARKVTRVES